MCLFSAPVFYKMSETSGNLVLILLSQLLVYEVMLIISRMLPPHLLFVGTGTTIALWFSLGHSSPKLIVTGWGRLHLYKK